MVEAYEEFLKTKLFFFSCCAMNLSYIPILDSYKCWVGITNTFEHHLDIIRASQSDFVKVSPWMIPWLKIELLILIYVKTGCETSLKKNNQKNLRTG
jgi:hypothetical protein